MSVATRTIVVSDEAELTPYLDGWDRLAVASRRPFCAPGWMLAWWREGRSGKMALRIVLVFEDDRLLGAGPFFGQISYGLTELRLLGAGFSHRIGPLAEPARRRGSPPPWPLPWLRWSLVPPASSSRASMPRTPGPS